MNAFRTSDLQKAAFVMTRVKLVGSGYRQGVTEFCFDDSDGKVTAALLEFANNTPVPIRSYLSCLKELKDIAFTNRIEQEGKCGSRARGGEDR